MLRVALGLSLAFATFGCASAPSVTPVDMGAPPDAGPVAGLGPVTVTELIDMRPESLKQTYGPHVETTYYVLVLGAGGAYVDGHRVEGATLQGDPGQMRSADVDRVITSLTGASQRVRAPAQASLEAVGVRDGRVIIPILDQMDAVALSSKNTMVGGSSYETGRSATTVTMQTTSGAATMSAKSPLWFNIRVRLLVGDMRNGQVVAMRWVYAHGHGTKPEMAWKSLVAGLGSGLAPRNVPAVAPAIDPGESSAPNPETPPNPAASGDNP